MDMMTDTLARIHFRLGERYLERGEHRAAAACFRRIVAILPEIEAGYAKLTLALTGRRDWPPVLAAYDRLARLNRDFARSAWAARTAVLREILLDAYGPRVLGGPFAGMVFDGVVTEGCFVPRMLGCYEAELHPHWPALARRNPEIVLNIGAAEGYYAVGLARMLPAVKVFAHDIDPAAAEACRRLASANGVAAQVEVGGGFTPEDFGRFAGRRVLVVCDVEGFEAELLDPVRAPALVGFDLVVELHDGLRPGLSEVVPRRFRNTHRVQLVANRPPDTQALPDALAGLSAADRALAVWESRGGPTPWAVMTAGPVGG